MATFSGGYLNGVNYQDTPTQYKADVWTTEIQREFERTFVMEGCISQRYLGQDVGKGGVVHLPTIGRVQVNSKTSGAPVVPQAYSEDELTFQVTRQSEISFTFDDVQEMFANYKYRSHYIKEAAYAFAQDFDNYILGLRATINGFDSQRQVIYNTSDGTATGTKQNFNEASFLAAMQQMDEDGIPKAGRKLIVSPGVAYDLAQIERFSSKDYALANTSNGMVGSLYGVPVISSNNMVTNSTTGYVNGRAAGAPTPGMASGRHFPTQSPNGITPAGLDADFVTCMLVHPHWGVMAKPKAPKTEIERQTLYISDLVVTHTVFDMVEWRPECCILINTAP